MGQKNKMEFNSGNFEQIVHGSTKNVSVETYESSSEDSIIIKNTVKDLGVFSTNDLLFEEHMKKIINSSKVVMGMLLRTFSQAHIFWPSFTAQAGGRISKKFKTVENFVQPKFLLLFIEY